MFNQVALRMRRNLFILSYRSTVGQGGRNAKYYP